MYGKKVQEYITAAKAAAGVPAEDKLFFSWEGFVKFLEGRTDFREIYEGGRAVSLEFPGIGILSREDGEGTIMVAYSDKVEGKRVTSSPLYVTVWHGPVGCLRFGTSPKDPVEKRILGLVKSYEITLSEELVTLPIPPWVEEVRTDWGTDVGPGMVSYELFRSEAEELWKEFAGSDPSGLELKELSAFRRIVQKLHEVPGGIQAELTACHNGDGANVAGILAEALSLAGITNLRLNVGEPQEL